MGAIAERRRLHKTAWRNLSIRAARAEAFAWIEVVTELFKAGRFASREDAVALLLTKVSKDDLKEYRRTKQVDPI